MNSESSLSDLPKAGESDSALPARSIHGALSFARLNSSGISESKRFLGSAGSEGLFTPERPPPPRKEAAPTERKTELAKRFSRQNLPEPRGSLARFNSRQMTRSRFAGSINSKVLETTQGRTMVSPGQGTEGQRSGSPEPMKLLTTDHPGPAETFQETQGPAKTPSQDSVTILNHEYIVNSHSWTPYENLASANPVISPRKRRYLQFRQAVASFMLTPLFLTSTCSTCVGTILIVAVAFAMTAGFLFSVLSADVPPDLRIQRLDQLHNFVMAFVFIFSSRHSFNSFLLGVSHEKVSFWHRRLSFLAVVTSALATFCPPEIRVYSVISLILLLLLILSATTMIYLNLYRAFRIIHGLLTALLLIVQLTNDSVAGFAIAFIYFFDRVLRFAQSSRYRSRFKIALIELVGRELVQLSFAREDFEYQAGQFMYLLVPEISFWEAHPFFFSSAPFHQTVHFNIRVAGDWTKRLARLCEKESMIVEVYMEGPYGAPVTDLADPATKLVLCVSAGINVCPVLSLANAFVDQAVRGRQLRRVLFFWSVRDFETVKATFRNCDLVSTFQKAYPELSQKAQCLLDKDLVYAEVYLSSLDIQNIMPVYIEEDFAHLKNLLFSQKIRPPEIIAKLKEEMALVQAAPEEVLVLVSGPAALVHKTWKLLEPLKVRMELFSHKT